ncbi:MAG: hypothetical protein K0U98_05595 [Deltaproteobacteria bacterium]|nr:hypothetical protein [Deltaproteobacteria bacterium]
MQRSRWPMLTLLFFLLLLAGAGAAVPFFLPKPAQVELLLKDVSFGQNLGGVSVAVTDLRSGRVISGTPVDEGSLARLVFPRLPSGQVELEVQAEGFRPAPVSFEALPLERRQVEVGLRSMSSRVLVSVVNARTEKPISMVRLVSQEGEEFLTGGPFTLILPAGKHSLQAEASGFCAGSREISLEEGSDVEFSLPLSPVLEVEEAARLVLDWAENPRDLDAHVLLENPGLPTNKRHVYFGKKEGKANSGEIYGRLDVDHTRSEGFETVTLYHRVSGTYRYLVNRYAGTGTLGASQATVAITTRGCKQKIYHVPETCQGPFWSVADLKVDATSVDILERNECISEGPKEWRRGKG